MKRKVIVSMAMVLGLLAGTATAVAGPPHWIAGAIFEEYTNCAVPFASLCLYDEESGELEYACFTAFDGIYSLPTVETDKIYRLTVSAPGYRTLDKKIRPQKVDIQGNVWYPLAIVRSGESAEPLAPTYSWTPDELGIDAKDVEAVYTALPCMDYEEGFATDKNGESVLILFNWALVPGEQYPAWVEYYRQHPVGGIEYYDLEGEGLYGGILNIFTHDARKPQGTYPAESLMTSTAWDVE